MIDHILTLLIAIPLLGAATVAVWPAKRPENFRIIALVALVLEVVLAAFLFFLFDNQNPEHQLSEVVDWITLPIGALGVVSIDYALALTASVFRSCCLRLSSCWLA